MADATKELGKVIGGLVRGQEEIKRQITPDDPSGTFTAQFKEEVVPEATVSVYKRRMSNVYIVGNPTYGVIGGQKEFTMPVTMPLELGKYGYVIGPYCILSHPLWSDLGGCILGDRDADEYERTLLYSTTL